VVKICAYRVIQEALTNAFRHGSPTGQAVTAQVVGERLVIRVTNRARKGGNNESHEPGLGLRGMRFRVESLGGTLRMRIGKTTASVEAEIPLGQLA
jgi:signal transduction histidine kinase